MSRVTDYVEERRNEIESEGRMRQDMRRVTVRLPGEVFAMLAEVAAALQDTNTGCAEELLAAAVEDAWHAVGPRSVEDLQRVVHALGDRSRARGEEKGPTAPRKQEAGS